MESNDDKILNGAILDANDTYSFANNNNFYAFVNQNFYDYYYRVVRRMSWWLDGYVIGFHDSTNGIFSTRLAPSLVKGIGNHICGKQIMFKKANASSSNAAVEFLDKWSNKNDFKNVVRDAVKYAAGLGTSLLKINMSSKELWCEAVRLDYFFFTIDSKGKLNEVYCMIKRYNNVQPNTKQERNYYLVEHRYFEHKKYKEFIKSKNGDMIPRIREEDVPMVEYQIKLYTGNELSYKTYSPEMTQNVDWNSIPGKVKDSIKKDYRIIEFGKSQQLPFVDHLGCELFKFDGSDITLPNAPFGTSVLQDIISYLMLYDLSFSYFARDMYNGKGSVLTPKQFVESGIDIAFNGLNKNIYEFVPTIDPEKQKPLSVQFEIRAQEWETVQNNLLKKIATTIGMSPKTIASYLEDNSSQKTATEIDAEDDSTISYIEIKRGIFETPINKILEIILNYYGIADDAKIKFATPSVVNQDKIIDRAIRKLESGLMTIKQALKEIYPDEDEEQLEQRYKEIVEEQNAQRAIEDEQNPFNL